MKQNNNRPVGICNWSLRIDIPGVVAAMRALSVTHVHLGIAPALGAEGRSTLRAIRAQAWTVTATMMAFPQEDYTSLESIRATGGIVPDAQWEDNRDLIFEAVHLTRRLGVDLLTFHLGFIDGRDQAYSQKLIDRSRCLADKAADHGITLALETGQESAAELEAFLDRLDHPHVGINFDPANMILYDKGDPIEALRLLGPRVKHCHIKDALYTRQPGTWGTEVPWGRGQVDTDAFLRTLTEIGYQGALAIERECGDNQLADIRAAIDHLTGD